MPEVPLDTWRRCLRDEYFATFLRQGGGTVKVVVGDDRGRREAIAAIRSEAEQAGVTVFDLTTDDLKLHAMDAVWASIAQRADWDGLTDRLLRKICAEVGFPMDDPAIPCTLDNVCATYDVDRSQVLRAYQPVVRDLVFRDYDLDIDYRKALAAILHGAFTGSDNANSMLARSWLECGDVLLRDLRELQIFQRIDRTRARAIFHSFVKSLFSNYGPSVFIFDGTRYYAERNRSGSLKFTRLHLFDLFEIIREFIDEADRLRGAGVMFVFPPDFVESERRSFGIYRALLSRIADEVRGRELGNPCAALVRVAT